MFLADVFHFTEMYTKSRIAESSWSSIFTLLRKLPTIDSSEWLGGSLQFHKQYARGSHVYTLFLTLSCYFIFMEWDDSSLWFWLAFSWWLVRLNIFCYVFVACSYVFENFLFSVTASFWIEFLLFLLELFTFFLCSGYKALLKCIAGMYFQNCFFALLVISFTAQKLSVFIKSYLSVFTFISCGLHLIQESLVHCNTLRCVSLTVSTVLISCRS